MSRVGLFKADKKREREREREQESFTRKRLLTQN